MSRDLQEQLDLRDLREPATKIAKAHGIDLAEMFGGSRERHVVACRREFYRLLVDMGWSSSAIGRLVGRDHTSVTNALRGKRRGGSKAASDSAKDPGGVNA